MVGASSTSMASSPAETRGSSTSTSTSTSTSHGSCPPSCPWAQRTPRRRQRAQRAGSIGASPPLLLLLLLACLLLPAEAGWQWPLWGGGNKDSGGKKGTTTAISAAAAAAVSLDGSGACEAGLLKGSGTVEGGDPEARTLVDGKENASTTDTGEAAAAAPRATFRAQRSHTQQMELRGRADLHEFLLSEAAKGPILNAQNWEQLRDGTYRCEMEPIAFFSAQIVPILDIRLEIDPHKRTAHIHAISGKVVKSDKKLAEADGSNNAGGGLGYACIDCGRFNETSFQMNTKNTVTWSHQADGKTVSLTTHLAMEVAFDKPAWMLVPNAVMNRVGSLVLRRVMKKALPQFLERIIQGYNDWAAEAATIVDPASPSAAGASTLV